MVVVVRASLDVTRFVDIALPKLVTTDVACDDDDSGGIVRHSVTAHPLSGIVDRLPTSLLPEVALLHVVNKIPVPTLGRGCGVAGNGAKAPGAVVDSGEDALGVAVLCGVTSLCALVLGTALVLGALGVLGEDEIVLYFSAYSFAHGMHFS